MSRRKEKVRLVNEEKGYAFAGNIFVALRDVPGGKLQLGDMIDCEEVTTGKGPKATDIKVNQIDMPAAPPQATTPTSASQEQEIAVKWMFVIERIDDKTTYLRVIITLKRGNIPAVGVKVSLNADEKEVTKPIPNPSTDGDGDVLFLVPLENNAKVSVLVATTGRKSYSKFWRMEEEIDEALNGKSASTPTKTEKDKLIHLDIQSAKTLNWMTFTVITRESAAVDSPLVPTKVSVRSQRGAVLAVRKGGDTEWLTGNQMDFDSTGSLVLEVKLFQLPTDKGGDFLIFRAGTTETQPNYQPSYVSGAAYHERNAS